MKRVTINMPESLFIELTAEAKTRFYPLSIYIRSIIMGDISRDNIKNELKDTAEALKPKKKPAKRYVSQRDLMLTEAELLAIRLEEEANAPPLGTYRDNPTTGEQEIYAYNTRVRAAHWAHIDHYGDNIADYTINPDEIK